MDVRLRHLAFGFMLFCAAALPAQVPDPSPAPVRTEEPSVPPEHLPSFALPSTEPKRDASAQLSGPRRPADIGSTTVTEGTHGNIFMNSPPPFTATGVLLQAEPGWPYIVVKPGQTGPNAGFAVYSAAGTTELMRVNGDGKVGIGTTWPEYALDVVGSGRFRGGPAEQVGLISVASSSSTGAPHTWSHFIGSPGGMAGVLPNAYELYEYPRDIAYPNPGWANLRLRIKPTLPASPNPGLFTLSGTGSVGINGRSGDLATLEVAAPNATTNAYAAASSYRGFLLSNGTDSSMVLRTLGSGLAQVATDGGNGALSFATGQFTEAMRIDSGGRVGIGTAAPGNLGGYRIPLTVTGPSWNYVRLIAAGSPIAGGIVYDRAGTTGFITAFNNDGRFRIAPVPSMTDVAVTNAKDQFAGITVDTTGNVSVGGSALLGAAFSVHGNVEVTGNIAAKYQDLAEWVPATTDLVPGTVVVLNPSRVNEVMASTRAYDTTVAGVVSAQPGVVLGESGATKEMVATTGRVRLLVDASGAAIRIGDLLVTSDTPGRAMKSKPIPLGGREIHQPGTIIGKALEPLNKGEGEILVLLSLQ
jgi:hypothetical protein